MLNQSLPFEVPVFLKKLFSLHTRAISLGTYYLWQQWFCLFLAICLNLKLRLRLENRPVPLERLLDNERVLRLLPSNIVIEHNRLIDELRRLTLHMLQLGLLVFLKVTLVSLPARIDCDKLARCSGPSAKHRRLVAIIVGCLDVPMLFLRLVLIMEHLFDWVSSSILQLNGNSAAVLLLAFALIGSDKFGELFGALKVGHTHISGWQWQSYSII